MRLLAILADELNRRKLVNEALLLLGGTQRTIPRPDDLLSYLQLKITEIVL
jgi:hypothetical protein